MGVGICCCTPQCRTFQVTVTECGVGVAGATVTYTQAGTTYGPWTTGSGGTVTVPVYAAGSATITAVPPTGATHYTNGTLTLTLSCSPLAALNSTVPLGLESGWTCTPNPCCSSNPGPPYAVLSYPSTISFSDGVGTTSLTNVGTSTTPDYRGTGSRTASDFMLSPGPCGGSPTNGSPGLVPVGFRFRCVGDGTWEATVQTFGYKLTTICDPGQSCLYSSTYPGPDTSCNQQDGSPIFNTAIVSAVPSSCGVNTLAWSASMTPISGSPLDKIYGTGTTLTATF